MKGNQVSFFHLFVIIISLGLCVQSVRTIVDLWHRRDIMRVRTVELEQKTRENAELQRKLGNMESDAYVEKVARDTLGLVKDGEAIVILPNQASSSENQEEEGNVPNWQKWWMLFF